ncbi:uncharacterized protein OCT59_016429 [Rhizophagus irregularis]|uniref:uncharacterized protein n=1 Tax=Rhizophagus irregularis TaxID=588596 RepID=UPI000CAECE84|nr:hypothetical protein OCT59_016429 [Rhizophagus irregularis]GBC31500.1 hypothetical protein RIR_jg31993.t1 [Rhizophagus irregularis DAOM 181602=DAOM 197198]
MGDRSIGISLSNRSGLSKEELDRILVVTSELEIDDDLSPLYLPNAFIVLLFDFLIDETNPVISRDIVICA